MDYLKDKQYYIDRYDLSTINDSLEMIDVCTKTYIKAKAEGASKGLTSKGDLAKSSNWFTNQLLFQIKGKRYRNKEETIKKWILEDTIKQDKYDTTPEPQKIRCPDCKKFMHVRIKQLETLDNPLRMMFLFECGSCKKRSWIYEDGQERPSTPTLCSKCKHEVAVSSVKEGKDRVVWKTTCSSCGFSETTIDDFKKSRLEWEKREKEEKHLLEVYWKHYCSEEAGKEALDYIDALPVAEEVYKEELKKHDSQAYQQAVNLKKLSIIDLEKLLKGVFEKERYIHFAFNKPEIGQHVIVTFTMQDTDSSRKQDKSISVLQKIIKDELETTNWRLMSDSLSYRLGYVSGRLKGYEREEDFLEISGLKQEITTSKIDSETRREHEGDKVVQLMKVLGQIQGVENVRKRRLKTEPNGFFLEGDTHLTCGICGENHESYKMWWNLEGTRCADCWRNIKTGIIPPLVHRYDDKSEYFQDWQLSSQTHFDIHPSTARKLRRQGLLRGRDLKREDESIYYTIYLNSENKEFLQKYPRKERQKMIITDLLGEKVEL